MATGYTCQDPNNFRITDDMKQDFVKDGYVLVKGLFSKAEVNHIEHALIEGRFSDHTYGDPDGGGRNAHIVLWNHPGIDVTGMVSRSEKVAGSCEQSPDDEGRKAHLVLWNHPGVDVTGMVARCEKIVGSCEQFLGGEVYHYHTKLMKKPAKIGGRHVWHQDYGYWYLNGCLFPDMMTVFIAVDKCTTENSCLQVLKGSHRCGRIDHVTVAGQVGADLSRVDDIAKDCPLVHVEMDPGDALFFHCNLLHCSSANKSEMRRWAFLCAYNKATNNPVIDHHHPRYTKLEKVANSAILACQDFTTMDGKWFADSWFESRDRPCFKIPPTEQ